jgi:tripartite-type tricarboxylate transporter receptor subunit TctC
MGIMAPAGLPRMLQARLTAEVEKSQAAPETGDRLAALGLDVSFGQPAEVTRTITTELALWGPLIRSRGLRVE